jgi:polysaccharide deacetylase family protein (PEP-CTERM system associated)
MAAGDSSSVPEAATAGHEPPFAMSVDVEDYFQVQAFAHLVDRSEWDQRPARVERNVERLLDILADARAHGTFFVLGWVANRYPSLVRRIAACGHEIGSHGMSHRMMTELTPDQVRDEVRTSRSLLEDISGTAVEGFRAPSYSINRRTRWVLDVLADAGYAYDSSIFPIRRRRYGYPEGPKVPVRLPTDRSEIVEFPMTTIGLGPIRLPVLAGSYLRLLPGWVSRAVVSDHLRRSLPLMVNVHPWEIDPGQPTVGPSRRKAWTHYSGLARTAATLRSVLGMARFASVASRLREMQLLDSPRVAGSMA